MIAGRRFFIRPGVGTPLTLLCIVCAGLYMSELFVYRSLTPYFFFSLGVSVFIILAGCSAAFCKASDTSISWPVVFLLLSAFYIFIYFILGIPNLYSYYLLTCWCFLIALYWRLKTYPVNMQWVFAGIVLCAVGECAICLLQYGGILHSLNSFFPATGTWDNPNVTAMFIVMATPAALSLLKNKKAIAVITVLLFAAVLLLLNCRTAIIGFLAIQTLFLGLRFQVTKKLAATRNRSGIVVIMCIAACVLLMAGSYSYQSKKASADGRKLIWKISAQMIGRKPLFGYGYGSFEKEYNLAQAQYFAQGDATADEIQNADFVKMAYNELLQHAVEGGLVGMLLFASVLSSLLLSYKTIMAPSRKNDTQFLYPSYTGIVAFSIMSCMNFTVQAIPVMAVFVIYGALVAVNAPVLSFKKTSVATKAVGSPRYGTVYTWTWSISLLVIGGVGLCYGIQSMRYNLINKHASVLAKEKKYAEALRAFALLRIPLDAYESYWTNYANTLLASGNYADALTQYQKATTLTSNPNLYLSMGKCYQKMNNYPDAIRSLKTAESIEPSHFVSRFALMNTYAQMKDTSDAVNEARGIMSLAPKVPSNEVSFFKYDAAMLLVKLGHPYIQSMPKSITFYHKTI